MRIWRLSSRDTIAGACNGEGAKKYGGRWNKKGTQVVYASATLSLCVLEILVHTDSDLLPHQHAYSIDVPDDLLIENLPDPLPMGWRAEPAPESLQEVGTAWVASETSAVLRLPSAIVPSEWNYILNPAHAAFSRITIQQSHEFQIDPRLRD